MSLVSVIVPTLNEELQLPGLLDHLATLRGPHEVLVVDGGSSDRTVTLARDHHTRPLFTQVLGGRARQMNAGAALAHGDVLLFLHADTRLAPDALARLSAALADASVIGGNFALRFDGGDRFSVLLGAWYAMQRRLGVYYGDSAIWVRADVFDRLGGFREVAIMEDYDFARRLERFGRTVCLKGPALTSARRWQGHGLPRTIAAWVLIRWLYLAGVPAHRLARLYPQIR